MTEETRNLLTAWFDGEVSAEDSRRVEELLDSEPGARAYVDDLKRTRAALQDAHAPFQTRIPDWDAFSKRLSEAGKRRPSKITWPRLAFGMGAMTLMGMAIWIPFRQASIEQSTANTGSLVERVESVETDIEGATPIVYLDQPSGWTVVWVLEAEESGS